MTGNYLRTVIVLFPKLPNLVNNNGIVSENIHIFVASKTDDLKSQIYKSMVNIVQTVYLIVITCI